MSIEVVYLGSVFGFILAVSPGNRDEPLAAYKKTVVLN